MDEIRNFLQKKHEEDMAEIKKAMNETKLETSLLQKNQRISVRSTESCEEVLKTLVPGVQHLTNRLQEVLDFGIGEDLSAQITETAAQIKKKVDELQPALASFVIGQNGLRKQISTEFELRKKEISETRAIEMENEVLRNKMQVHQNAVVELQSMVKKRQETKMKQSEDFYETLILPLLTGDLAWMKQKIRLINGDIQIANGDTMNVSRFREYVQRKPWAIFPEEYEVECCSCYKTIPISTCLREDKVSVKCFCGARTSRKPKTRISMG